MLFRSNDTATTEIYTLFLHDALPICGMRRREEDAAARLSEWRERMVARGVQAGPVQMIYCTQYGGEECDLELTEEGGPVLPE